MNPHMQSARGMASLICALSLWGVSAQAHAALSGYYDSLEQIQVVVNDQRVANALKQLPIESIEIEGDPSDRKTTHWRVRSQACELSVQLHVKPPPGPGKTTYVLQKISACR